LPKAHVAPKDLATGLVLATLAVAFSGKSIIVKLGYISASLESLILYLNPTLVLLLGLVFGHEIKLEGANAALGTPLVFLSAVSYAVYLSFSGELVRRLGSLSLVGLGTSVACVLCIGRFVLLRPMCAALVAPEVIWLSVINATLCTAVPLLMVMMAIERIGVGLAAQAVMVGPMSTFDGCAAAGRAINRLNGGGDGV
jgi:drug/metabolite transporter (DMT)-like permease